MYYVMPRLASKAKIAYRIFVVFNRFLYFMYTVVLLGMSSTGRIKSTSAIEEYL